MDNKLCCLVDRVYGNSLRGKNYCIRCDKIFCSFTCEEETPCDTPQHRHFTFILLPGTEWTPSTHPDKEGTRQRLDLSRAYDK